jgi:hypothetical protein
LNLLPDAVEPEGVAVEAVEAEFVVVEVEDLAEDEQAAIATAHAAEATT